jgi:hypothetical protein
MAINPQYIFIENGQRKKISWFDKNKIPHWVNDYQIVNEGFCHRRIQSLDYKKNSTNLTNPSLPSNSSNTNLSISPNVCDFNIISKEKIEEDKQNGIETPHDTKSFMDDTGISELKQLYNDLFNPQTGLFDSMSKESSEQYKQDLLKVYRTYTNDLNINQLPEDVSDFSDIFSKPFHKTDACISSNNTINSISNSTSKGMFTRPFEFNTETMQSNELLVKYAKNLRELTDATQKKHIELMEIIHQIFVFENSTSHDNITPPIPQETNSISSSSPTTNTNDIQQTQTPPYTPTVPSKDEITVPLHRIYKIHPELTKEKLQLLITYTRENILLPMYIYCEDKYIHGIQLFQAIVEEKIQKNLQEELQTLEKEKELLLYK